MFSKTVSKETPNVLDYPKLTKSSDMYFAGFLFIQAIHSIQGFKSENEVTYDLHEPGIIPCDFDNISELLPRISTVRFLKSEYVEMYT